MTWDSYSFILRRQGSEGIHTTEAMGEAGQGKKDGAHGGSQATLGSPPGHCIVGSPAP